MRSLVGGALLIVIALAAAPARAYDPATEASNFARTQQRFSHDQTGADYQQAALAAGIEGIADILVRDAESGGQRFSGSLCGSGTLTCAGDPRVYDWAGAKGVMTPVVYINRNGAHIEGHVWAGKRQLERVSRPRRDGKPRRGLPGVVLQTGSVQAPERWYLWAAQVLAAHGYVVMTFDVQGQGRSDLMGSHDEHAFDGVPAQDVDHFVEDLEDALDFFNSTASAPYKPPTAHGAARQTARAQEGEATRFNPLAAVLDRGRLGIVGHSLGAQSVSIVQETDPRVDAVVAWDNLSGGVTPRVPALGMAADYGLVAYPNLDDPDPDAKTGAFRAWKAAGVPAMEVVIRGGTHFEWSYSPSPVLPASLRGIDASAWYTTAWLDRYVKGREGAERRLLTDRWLADPVDAQVDPDGAGNLFSFYHRSAVAIDGFECSDLRTGCAGGLTPDGKPGTYSFMEDRG